MLLLFGPFLYLPGQAGAVRSYLEKYGTPEMLPPGGPDGYSGKIMVPVPSYDEGKIIVDVPCRVPKSALGRETKTLVVVDGATDDTDSAALETGVPMAASPAVWPRATRCAWASR